VVANVDEPEFEESPEEVTLDDPDNTPEPETQVAPEEEPAAPPTSGDSTGGEEEIAPPDALMQMLGGSDSTEPDAYPGPGPGPGPAPAPPTGDTLPPAPDRDTWLTDPGLAAQMQERRFEAMVATRIANLADQTTQNSEQLYAQEMRRRAEAFAAVETEKQRATASVRSHFKDVFSRDPHYRGNPKVKEFVDQSMQLMTQRAVRAGRHGDPRGFMQINNATTAKALLGMAYAAHNIPFGSSPAPVKIAGSETVKGKRPTTARPKLDPEQVAYAARMGITEDELIEAIQAEEGGA
jgi:hypothetical protein